MYKIYPLTQWVTNCLKIFIVRRGVTEELVLVTLWSRFSYLSEARIDNITNDVKQEAMASIRFSTGQVQQILKNVKDPLEWHLSATVTCPRGDRYYIIEDNSLCKLSCLPCLPFSLSLSLLCHSLLSPLTHKWYICSRHRVCFEGHR